MKYLLLLLFLFPGVVFASFPAKYDMSRAEIKKYCNGVSSLACYFPTDNVILMNKDDLKGDEYKVVYYHELGHYYLRGVKLTPLFLNNTWYGQEMAADGFSAWIRGKKLDKKYSDFYSKIYKQVNSNK